MSLTVDMESDSVYHQTHTIHTDQEEEEEEVSGGMHWKRVTIHFFGSSQSLVSTETNRNNSYFTMIHHQRTLLYELNIAEDINHPSILF